MGALQDYMKRYFQVGAESQHSTLMGTTYNTVLLEPNTDPMINIPFLTDNTAFTLAAPVAADAYQLTAVAGHTIVDGRVIELAEGEGFTQATVTNVNVNLITFDTRASQAFTVAATAQHSNQNIETAVGSQASPIIYSVLPLSTPVQKGEIHRVMFSIQDASGMDTNMFGSSTTLLTNGMLLRVNNGDGTYENIFNFKSNNDFNLQCGNDFLFPDRFGGTGSFAYMARCSFNGEDKRGVVILLDGSIGTGRSLELVVQDNISALGQDAIRMVAQGHLIF